MFILTDSVKALISELATAGRLEMSLDENGVHVTVDCGIASKKRDSNCAKCAPKPEKPYFGRKRGRKPAPQYKVIDGVRRRVRTFKGESLTVEEWAKRYGVCKKTMESRFRTSGTPETTKRRSRYDKTALKAKLAGGAK